MKLISARVAIALTLAVGGPAAASDIFRYECGAARSVPPAKDDPDPVYKTVITIWFTGTQTNPTGFTVKHHTASGEIHSREDQYRDIQRQSTLGYDRWSGVSIKDPKLTMIGTLSDDQVKGKPVARYVEKLFRNGRLQNTVTSVCRPIDEDIK